MFSLWEEIMMTGDSIVQNQAELPQRDYYQALYQTALTISSSLEFDQVLQSIVTSTSEAMQVKACALRLLDQESGQLRLSAVHGLSAEYLAKGPIHLGTSQIDSEAMAGKSVYIRDVRIDPRFQYKDAARQEGLVSVLCIPLEVHGKYIGVLRVYTDIQTEFVEDDIQFMSVLASLAALGIENARLYESMKSTYHEVMNAFWGF
jgi:GAF domain-containing protein